MKSKRRIEDAIIVALVGLLGLLLIVGVLLIPVSIIIFIMMCAHSDINLSIEAWAVIIALIGLVFVYLGRR